MKSTAALMALLLAGTANAATWTRTQSGVSVSPDAGPAKTVTVNVYGDGILHVVAAPAQATAPREGSLMVPAPPAALKWSAREANG